MVRAVRAKVRANKKYDFGPGENTILVRAKNTILVRAKKNTILVRAKIRIGPGENTILVRARFRLDMNFIKNTILLRAKIRFRSGRKYDFGLGEISPGHEFYKKYDFAPGENMILVFAKNMVLVKSAVTLLFLVRFGWNFQWMILGPFYNEFWQNCSVLISYKDTCLIRTL